MCLESEENAIDSYRRLLRQRPDHYACANDPTITPSFLVFEHVYPDAPYDSEVSLFSGFSFFLNGRSPKLPKKSSQ